MTSPPPPSAPRSPTPPPPPVPEDLTNWFLQAKRSLSSIALCTRGHALVSSARAALQDASYIAARCTFLRRSLADQLKLARAVNAKMVKSREDARGEFEKTLSDLDTADLRLNGTLEALRNTVVEAAFYSMLEDPAGEHDPASPTSTDASSDTASPRSKTLHDFVDDTGIESLKSRLRAAIDAVQDSHDTLSTSLGHFSSDLSDLTAGLQSLPDLHAPENAAYVAPLHPHLHVLEEHTAEMALCLESLTTHFDRCSAALKDAESSSPTHSAQERTELYAVLAADAGQVDSVVAEIRERLQEMESVGMQLTRRVEALEIVHGDTRQLFALFADFAGNLGRYLEVAGGFAATQAGLREEMAVRLEELVALAEFYEGFLVAYDAMVVEVARRKGVAERREALARDMERKLEKMGVEEEDVRAGFRQEWGEWLPSDLWRGIADPPISYRVERELHGGRELPTLQKEVVDAAMRRQGALGRKGRG